MLPGILRGAVEDNFSFTVTFHEYGIDGYWLGDQVFMLDEETWILPAMRSFCCR